MLIQQLHHPSGKLASMLNFPGKSIVSSIIELCNHLKLKLLPASKDKCIDPCYLAYKYWYAHTPYAAICVSISQ